MLKKCLMLISCMMTSTLWGAQPRVDAKAVADRHIAVYNDCVKKVNAEYCWSFKIFQMISDLELKAGKIDQNTYHQRLNNFPKTFLVNATFDIVQGPCPYDPNNKTHQHRFADEPLIGPGVRPGDQCVVVRIRTMDPRYIPGIRTNGLEVSARLDGLEMIMPVSLVSAVAPGLCIERDLMPLIDLEGVKKYTILLQRSWDSPQQKYAAQLKAYDQWRNGKLMTIPVTIPVKK